MDQSDAGAGAAGGASGFISKAASQFQQLTSSFTEASKSVGSEIKSAGGSSANSGIPFAQDPSNEEVWIMGRKYYAQEDFHILRKEIRSRLWFSYRKDFPAIGDSGLTTDRGWGCMLRCGQMVVAESLQR